MLRKTRRLFAILMLVAATFLFIDVSDFAHNNLAWIAKIQFLPALFSLSIITLIALVVITLVLGRIYCSVICPMGILQDVFARLGLKAKKNRYSYSKAKTALRWAMVGVCIVVFLFGANALVALVAPYSSFGRIAQNLFAPLYGIISNYLADYAEAHNSYAISQTDVWIRSLPTFVVASITFVVVAVLAWRNGRTYCNTICPVGTILGTLSKFSVLAPIIDKEKCISCRKCERNCKASCIDIKGNKEIDHSRCVACFNCTGICPKGAISYTFRKKRNVATESIVNKQETSERRTFLTMIGMTAASVASAQKDKLVDGGLTVIKEKVAPHRETPIVPPGAESLRNFSAHCTACQLCVAQCPNGVLRPSTDLLHLMQPTMSYERGYCRPECNRCSQVCPAGAIKPISKEDKSSTRIGHAVWVKELCVVLTDDVSCGNCARHCPAGAIQMVEIENEQGKKVFVPAVNEERCIGCGACENLCPSRPLSAIYVEGHENHSIK